ncbi:hypothetical protein [Thalassobellus citreus]|uniref:hypothetical protein n=1 Tax=Thalassobellus citreus TaxID=3367752 RepID=UPI003789F80A
MKRIIFGIVMILFIGILISLWNIPMTKFSVIGTYANTNYEKKHCCIESPHKAENLTLKSDGTFSSDFYGNGNYKVSYGILNTEIELHYENINGKSVYHSYFINKIFENPKIVLNYDMNHYYQKTE